MAMRYLVLLLLLTCGYSQAAAVICPDGLTYVDTNTALCPVNSTNISLGTPGQTTATISATADAQAAGSTGYHWTSSSTHPAGCTTLHYLYATLSDTVTATRQAAEKARQKCMNWKTMVAGTGATSYGSAAISVAGIYTVPITGLTASQTYYTQHFVMGGVGGAGKVGKLSTQQFATNSSGAAPGETYVEDAGAAPRYVGTGGNDASDGLTHATRWLRTDLATHPFCALPAGTNIALLNTSVFSVMDFTICHGGTSLDRNIVGSYKLNGSSVPIWTVDGTMGATTADQKAEFLGGVTAGCLSAGTCNFAESFPVENFTGHYDCTVQLTSAADYTTIKNIAINKQRWCPMSMKGDSNSNRNLTNVFAEDIDLADNGDGHVHFFYLTGAVIRGFTVLRANTCYQQRSKSGATGSVTGCPGPWGGALPVIGSRQVLIENNYVDDTFGEVYQPFSDNAYIIVRGNFSGNSLTVCIYGDSSRYTVVENNICNLKDEVYIGYSTIEGYRTAIEQNMEYYGANVPPPGSNDYVTVRNNLIVNASAAMSNEIYPQIIASDPAYTRITSGYWNGNTIIGATSSALNFWSANSYNVQRVPFFYAKNNVIWSPDLGAYACRWNQQHSAVDITYSHWDATQILDTDCNGAGDSAGDPLLTVSNIATWRAYEAKIGSPATLAAAIPQASSPLKDSGVVSEDVIYTWADFGIAATEMTDFKLGEGAGGISSTNWVKERYYDALNNVLGATPPKGAVCPAGGC